MMRFVLWLVPPLILASCISFPRAEKMRREGKTLTPKFDPWQRKPDRATDNERGSRVAPHAEGESLPQQRKAFKDPYFRQS